MKKEPFLAYRWGQAPLNNKADSLLQIRISRILES